MPSRVRSLVRFILVAGYAILLPASGAAQQQAGAVNHSWDVLVRTASVGTRVTVVEKSRARVAGEIVAIDGGQIVLAGEASRVAVPAADVFQVLREGVRRRNILIGIPIGMFAGGLTALLIDRQSRHPEPGEAFAMGAVLVGLPIGAAVGAAMPVQPLLYEAPRSSVSQIP